MVTQNSDNLSGNPLSVSIITVNLNNKKELEKTILSVQSQDYPAIQHVIVDGGSTDGSLDVIREHSNKKMVWLSEPDKGIYDAMNKGTRMAKCKWINFLNSGDTFVNEHIISDIFKKIEPVDDLVYGDTCFISGEKHEIIKAREPETLWQALNFNHNSLFVRRDILLQHPFSLNYNIVADSEFVIWCFKNGCKFKNTGILINNYPRGGHADKNSIMRTVERWKIVSDYKLEDQHKINKFYFLRLLWEKFYVEFLKELGFKKNK